MTFVRFFSVLAMAATLALPVALADADAPKEIVMETPDIPVWQPQGGETISFIVRRNGSKFGTHQVTFERDEAGILTVENDISLKVKLGPITAYNYAHESTETWSDGVLKAISGKTRKERKDLTIEATNGGETLKVDGTRFQGELPANIVPSSHWNIQQMFSSAILSSEGGQVLPIEVVREGTETVEVNGEDVAATKFLLKSDLDVNLWYDEAGRWVKCSFDARGQNIVYELQDLY